MSRGLGLAKNLIYRLIAAGRFLCYALSREANQMANESSKDFNAMLHDGKDMPRI